MIYSFTTYTIKSRDNFIIIVLYIMGINKYIIVLHDVLFMTVRFINDVQDNSAVFSPYNTVHNTN